MAQAEVTAVKFSKMEYQHRRYNPLIDEWILVSPHRVLRPWQGQMEPVVTSQVPRHDLNNPLCPGATRSNGEVNPNYEATFVFANDFPAMLEHGPEHSVKNEAEDPLFRVSSAQGSCYVMCFHPWSDLSIPLMKELDVIGVVNKWCKLVNDMGKDYEWIQIFENKGSMMGCSNPHPHCQVWASNFLPTQASKKDRAQCNYFEKYGRPLLVDYLRQELDRQDRLVCTNDHWVCLVPFWAVWPFETMLLPRRHISRMNELSVDERKGLANIMQQICVKYDNLFMCSFPYTMGFHGAPTGIHLETDANEYWQLHAVYMPPLLRSASVRKFMVGYELLAEAQRDLTPETSAHRLRESPQQHYSLSLA